MRDPRHAWWYTRIDRVRAGEAPDPAPEIEGLTFAQELAHASQTEPIADAAVQGRRRIQREPIDSSGDFIRVYERDDPEALQHALRLNTEKDVWASDVWRDIVNVRHDHPSQAALREEWHALTDEQKFRYHVACKAPNPADAAWWIGFRNGQAAHARLLDRHQPHEVWVQWIVGTKALGQSGHTLFLALWDIGVRRVCWKFLPNHRLVGFLHQFPDFTIEPAESWETHHPGHYLKGRYDMRERPRFYGRGRKSA